MKIERQFHRQQVKTPTPRSLDFTVTSSEIRNPDGTVVFKLDGMRSSVQVEPGRLRRDRTEVLPQGRRPCRASRKSVKEKGVPSFLWRSVPDEKKLAELPEAERFGGETSAKQVFDRLAGAWCYWGWKGGYFTSEDDAQSLFRRNALSCSPNQMRRAEQRRSGSTRAYIGPMASTVRRQGHLLRGPRERKS